MLAGETPYTGSTWPAVLIKRFTEPAPSVRVLRPDVPDEVDQVIRRALARDPAERFATAGELVSALHSRAWSVTLSRSGRWLRRFRTSLLPALGLGFVLGLGVLFAWHRSRVHTETPAPKRIAVLPFVNLNPAEDQYFADGITDDVRGKLAALPGIQVIARSSSGQYAQTTKRPQDIGRELAADYLLTGTVRWEKGRAQPGRVRVSPELVQAATGSTHWQEPFDAPLTDVFQVQADIAGRVAQALNIALAVGQQERLAVRPTRSLAAYDLYLRGKHAFHRRTGVSLGEARDLFEKAIAQDPQFALAHAGLAEVYTVLPFWMDTPPRQSYPRAAAAAAQALRLDSTMGTAHAVLADVSAMYEWDWAAAERGFRRALELDPDDANIHHWYGEDLLIVMGRGGEALREGRRAQQLDPLVPVFGTSLAQTLVSLGRSDEALALLDDILSLDPDFPLAHETRGLALLHAQRLDDAARALQRNLELRGRQAMTMALLGYAYTKVNRRKDAEHLLDELRARDGTGYVSGTALATLHAGLGDTTEAFQRLNQAAEERDPLLVYFFVVDPILRGLRAHPEGGALLERMNLARD
jgi:TolB-like protein/Tfp pilus assembly protein PilF